MENSPSPQAPQVIDDLFLLHLADGLPATSEGRELRYKLVRLRETNVADERQAERLSERAMQVAGAWKLLVSESNFKHALNMLHIDAFVCDGQEIGRALVDLAMYDKLSSHDLELIEQRIFLITLASEVRYGNMTPAEFEGICAGLDKPAALAAPPQPTGQAPRVGAPAAGAESGPALLADYLGDAAQSPAQGYGGTAE